MEVVCFNCLNVFLIDSSKQKVDTDSVLLALTARHFNHTSLLCLHYSVLLTQRCKDKHEKAHSLAYTTLSANPPCVSLAKLAQECC